MKIFITIILFLICMPVLAENRDWTEEEKIWGATAAVFTMTDWATTRNMTKRYNENYHELNPLLGTHPTTAQVNQYFAITVPVMYLIADNLDQYRSLFLMGLTGIELAVSANNLRIGLHLNF